MEALFYVKRQSLIVVKILSGAKRKRLDGMGGKVDEVECEHFWKRRRLWIFYQPVPRLAFHEVRSVELRQFLQLSCRKMFLPSQKWNENVNSWSVGIATTPLTRDSPDRRRTL
jgi:hypothetical protein